MPGALDWPLLLLAAPIDISQLGTNVVVRSALMLLTCLQDALWHQLSMNFEKRKRYIMPKSWRIYCTPKGHTKRLQEGGEGAWTLGSAFVEDEGGCLSFHRFLLLAN